MRSAVLLLAFGLVGACLAQNPRSKLIKDLLADYDANVRPVNDLATPTPVKLGMYLFNFELKEHEGVLESFIFFQVEWQDEYLRWNQSDYNTDRVFLDNYLIWTPDVTIYLAKTGADLTQSRKALAFSNGTVMNVVQQTTAQPCVLDLTNWPFDVQECMIVAGPWVYSHLETPISLQDIPMNLDDAVSTKWTLVDSSAVANSTYYPCCPEPYDSATFTLKIRRSSIVTKALAVIPMFVAQLLTLVAFWIPAHKSQRFTVGGLAVLLSFLILLTTRLSLPDSQSTPRIFILQVITLIIASLSLVSSTALLHFSSAAKSVSGLISGLCNRDSKDFKSLGSVDSGNPGDSGSSWSVMTDRFLFLVFAATIFVALTAFFPFTCRG